MASGADDATLPPKPSGTDDAALPAKMNEPAPFRWKDLPSEGACMPVLGVAELWPELGSAAASAKGKGKAAASSVAPKTTAALPEQIPGANGKQNPGGASPSRHGSRAGSSSAMQPSPMNMMMQNNNRERPDAAPRQPPMMHAPSHRNNNYAGGRGHHQNGRFVPHSHGRGNGGSEGYNRGGRPVGGANGRGQANVNVNGNGNAYRNRGGGSGWHGQEHRGGFNGQPRGRGHHGPEHRPLGPPMSYVEAPHHMHQPPLPPPQQFMGMVPPPMPYSYYYGLPYGYQEFVPYFAPPLQEDLPHFMPEALQPFVQVQYAWPQMHMMHANLEQQQQYGPQLHAQEQQLTPEELQQEIRQQIEYYFSARNLEGDAFLRAKMDEQGWVPLTVVASFWKISRKTKDIEFILNSVLPSTEVEVQDGKIRKRVGWEEYPPLPASN